MVVKQCQPKYVMYFGYEPHRESMETTLTLLAVFYTI